MSRYLSLGLYLGTNSALLIDAGVAVMLLLVAFAAPLPQWTLPSAMAARVRALAARPRLCLLLAALAGPLIRLLLLPLLPVPEPFFHDEYSHLLAADTFASGRVTNPTHPMWVHFENVAIDQQPTYMSMEFPSQGLTLALGKSVFGKPWFGVVLSIGLMCAAIGWMLQGWLSPEWALLGIFLVTVRLGIVGYWMNSYWGGALSATGGALLLGALPRLMLRPRPGNAFWMAAGIVLLATSRPYEGVLLCIPVAVALLRWAAGPKRPPLPLLLRHVVLPVAAVLLIAAAAMAWYDWRVFGSPGTLPYQNNRASYAVAPYFLWQTPRPEPPYRHKLMRDFYVGLELQVFRAARTPAGILEGALKRLATIPAFFFGATLSIPLLMLPGLFRDPRARFLLAAAAVSFAGLLAVGFMQPHYLAPATSLYFTLLLLSMERLQTWRFGREPAGAFLVAVIPCLSVLLLGVQILFLAIVPKTDLPRFQVQQVLGRLPGPHLVIVRYAPDHDPRDDWVYNAADMDSAPIVWAREMDPARDRELIRYFHGRMVWLVQVDQSTPKITPYPN